MPADVVLVADRSLTVPDLSKTAEQAAGYARQAKAANTRRAYLIAWTDFSAWCEARDLVAMPADPAGVGLYLADRAQTHKVASLRLRLVAIAEAHRLQQQDLNTRHPAIRDTWAGIRRAHGTAPTQKAAATGAMVRAMLRPLSEACPRALRDRALILVGFAAALRRSELVALDLEDLQFRAEGVVLRLRRSKTDQLGAGAEVAIPYGSTEQTCPVRALQAWIDAAGITAGAVFRSISKAGRVLAPRLSDRDVARIVKRLAEQAGLDPAAFSGHSLRAGFATTAAGAGVPEAEIMRQTRHRSAAVMRGYVRRGTLFTDNAAARVGL